MSSKKVICGLCSSEYKISDDLDFIGSVCPVCHHQQGMDELEFSTPEPLNRAQMEFEPKVLVDEEKMEPFIEDPIPPFPREAEETLQVKVCRKCRQRIDENGDCACLSKEESQSFPFNAFYLGSFVAFVLGVVAYLVLSPKSLVWTLVLVLSPALLIIAIGAVTYFLWKRNVVDLGDMRLRASGAIRESFGNISEKIPKLLENIPYVFAVLVTLIFGLANATTSKSFYWTVGCCVIVGIAVLIANLAISFKEADERSNEEINLLKMERGVIYPAVVFLALSLAMLGISFFEVSISSYCLAAHALAMLIGGMILGALKKSNIIEKPYLQIRLTIVSLGLLALSSFASLMFYMSAGWDWDFGPLPPFQGVFVSLAALVLVLALLWYTIIPAVKAIPVKFKSWREKREAEEAALESEFEPEPEKIFLSETNRRATSDTNDNIPQVGRLNPAELIPEYESSEDLESPAVSKSSEPWWSVSLLLKNALSSLVGLLKKCWALAIKVIRAVLSYPVAFLKKFDLAWIFAFATLLIPSGYLIFFTKKNFWQAVSFLGATALLAVVYWVVVKSFYRFRFSLHPDVANVNSSGYNRELKTFRSMVESRMEKFFKVKLPLILGSASIIGMASFWGVNTFFSSDGKSTHLQEKLLTQTKRIKGLKTALAKAKVYQAQLLKQVQQQKNEIQTLKQTQTQAIARASTPPPLRRLVPPPRRKPKRRRSRLRRFSRKKKFARRRRPPRKRHRRLSKRKKQQPKVRVEIY